MAENATTASQTEPVTDNSDTSDTGTQESQSESIFDPTPYADQLVSVKVDGEELQVPLKEALSGYMRQAKFTKNSQELARQREEAQFGVSLAQALEEDPQATLEYVARIYGVSLAAAKDIVEEELDPEQEWKAKTEARLDDHESREALRQARDEYSSLEAKYGDLGIEFEELLSTAVEIGAKNLDIAYRSVAFEREQAKLAEERKAADQEAREGKRSVTSTQGGSTASQSSQSLDSELTPKEGESPREFLARCLKASAKEHGVELD